MSLRLSGGRKLLSPPGEIARPTASRVRLAVMNMLAAELPGAHWLDLFCGSGVMGCEALLRGAAQVVAVEQDRHIGAIAQSNLETVASSLQPRPSFRVVQQEAIRWLSSPHGEGFDLVYADPPYAAGLYGSLLEALAAGDWLRPQALVLLEHATKNPPEIPAGWELEKQKRYGSCSLVMLSRC
ncbi:16S rRNA (guanine(966)-N(2))-methyltransferase RsmD [Synechococcus sp. W4D4]|uniref:16S rRNA (guanine(966)-N(2))-methyltransferase RsmD n=1 Tax=Synechococcus sp. W4D4 TaxID=3392294 RepID=UPI0039EC25A1